ncbi:MAG: hypothetical protein AB9915_00885 [Candidatus Dojkabacteria bacterium]
MRLKLKLDIKQLLNYVLLTLLTSVIITTILVALPLTEKISSKTTFNLITKDKNYWSKEYVLKLDSADNKKVEKTRDIMYKRLDSFGVEDVSIYKDKLTDESSALTIVINSTKSEQLVSQLLKNRFDVRIVSKKEDVSFEDSENQYAYLMPSSYNDTGWGSKDFRNVYITKLKSNDGTYSFYAIFKPWTWRENQFKKLLSDNKGKYLGVYTDGYVSPYMVPLDNNNSSVFAIPIQTEDKDEIKAISILYNSGIIPLNISLTSEKELVPQIISLDHIRVSIGLMISLVVVYLYLAIFKHTSKDILIKSFLATILTLSIYLAGLKLLAISVDTFILPVVAILTMILIRVISENEDSVIYIETTILAILLLMVILGVGYLPVIANHLVALIIISKLSIIFSNWYIYKVKNI